MPRRKSKRGNVALGFVLTVGVLSLLTLVLLESGGPSLTVVRIPSKLPAYSGLLGRYAPSDALQVSFDNLTAIRSINQSVIANQQFFELDQPSVSVETTAVDSRLTVGLSVPNATVTIATLDTTSFATVAAALEGASNAIPTDKVANTTLYAAAGTQANETQAYWLTVIPADRALVYSPGANDALQAMQRIIGVYRGTVPSILSNAEVDRMLYAVNGTQGHLALGVQNFAGSVQTGQATVISVDATQSSTVISYVVRFTDADQASGQVGAVKATYISAHQFFRYDELVKAVEVQPISQLKVGVGLVG
jgi:hypothetical protein